MVGEHRVEGVDFGSPNCPESIFTPGQFFGSLDALGKDSSTALVGCSQRCSTRAVTGFGSSDSSGSGLVPARVAQTNPTSSSSSVPCLA